MKISVLDRNGLLGAEAREAFRQRARLGLGKFASKISQVVLQAGVSNVPRLARTQPLVLMAILKSHDSVVVTTELTGDDSTIASATERLCRAVGLRLRS